MARTPFAASGGDGAVDVVGVTGADGHVRPLVGERLGDGAPDALRAAGDDGVQAFESQIHGQLPSTSGLAR